MRWLLVLPAAIAVLEWFRGWFLSGFPWLALGYTQTDAPLAAIAPLGGVYAVSFAVALSAGALVALLFGDTRDAHRRGAVLSSRSGFSASRCGIANGRSRPAGRSPSRSCRARSRRR